MAYVALMETTTGTLTVGQVARLTGVTVRTLHHYDEISLLTPGDRSSAGYRRYIGEDLDRLHRILGYRALGLSLESIAEILDDRGTSAEAHLRRQRELVRASVERLEELLETIDKELEGLNVGINLTPEERFEVFGDLPEFDKSSTSTRPRPSGAGARRTHGATASSAPPPTGRRSGSASATRGPRASSASPRPCARARHRPMRLRSSSPRSTAATSGAGSTTARSRCTSA